MSVTLDPTAEARAYRLETCDTIGSTNDGVMERAAGGDLGRLWLVADEQTGGKGRLGRHWSSPPGNLYASLLLIDPAAMDHVAELGFVMGVACASAVLALGVPSERLAIKWPNDLLADGAKLSGVLLETRPVAQGLAVAMGIGLNCRSSPSQTAYPTTHLSDLLGRPVSVAAVFFHLSRTMADALDLWDRGANFAAIRALWLEFAGGIGTQITVDLGTKRVQGLFRSIDRRGRLLLDAEDGPIVVDAGDVFLRQG